MENWPVPQPDGDTKPYWEAARRHELHLQHCAGCGSFLFYPRAVCPSCMSEELPWQQVSGRGTVYSFVVVHRAPPGFEDEAPYTVALVDLAEGPRMQTRIVGCAPAQVSVGMAVAVDFIDVNAEYTLPVFRPL